MAKYIVLHGIRIAKDYKDFIPETFGRLTTIGPRFLLPYGNTGQYVAFQVCQCVCGNASVHRSPDLSFGRIKSCGCLLSETAFNRMVKHGKSNGKSYEYYAWSHIKQRCYNTNVKQYKDYGGRGITVCDRWLCPVNGFANFLADMGPRPSRKHSIDRIDVNGNYCPENCRWATRTEQMRNTRRSVNITYNGKTQCLSAWAGEYGISPALLRARLLRGWSMEISLTLPTKREK